MVFTRIWLDTRQTPKWKASLTAIILTRNCKDEEKGVIFTILVVGSNPGTWQTGPKGKRGINSSAVLFVHSTWSHVLSGNAFLAFFWLGCWISSLCGHSTFAIPRQWARFPLVLFVLTSELNQNSDSMDCLINLWRYSMGIFCTYFCLAPSNLHFFYRVAVSAQQVYCEAWE